MKPNASASLRPGAAGMRRRIGDTESGDAHTRAQVEPSADSEAARLTATNEPPAPAESGTTRTERATPPADQPVTQLTHRSSAAELGVQLAEALHDRAGQLGKDGKADPVGELGRVVDPAVTANRDEGEHAAEQQATEHTAEQGELSASASWPWTAGWRESAAGRR